MSMAVRFSDKARKQELDKWIDENGPEIRKLLERYKVPLVDPEGKLLTDGSS
jgi:hypothetical protein